MKTDVLFIHRQLAFAVSIKQALERTGSYDVHPFTSVEAAVEYLRGHQQDVALIDFMMPVYSGEEILGRVRDIQPQITVVATPAQTEGEFERLGLHGMLAATFTAREFIPVVERALEGRRTGELPTGKGAGLLGRVQDTDGAEKRPPTSVIGYRSLESILDEGASVSQAAPPPAEDATLIEALPVVAPATNDATLIDVYPVAEQPDDLSFLNDVVTGNVAAPRAADPLGTDRLTETGTEDLPPGASETPIGTEPLGLSTEPLPPLEAEWVPQDDAFAGFDASSFGAEFGTRPLSEIDAEEAAAQLAAPRSSEFDSPTFAIPGIEAAEYEPDIDLSLFGQSESDDESVLAAAGFSDSFGEFGEQEAEEVPVDFMAFLNLQPQAPAAPSDAPAWLSEPVPQQAGGPSDDEIYTGLQTLFPGDESATESESEEFSFEDVPIDGEPPADDFAGVLDELVGGDELSRQRSEFDELVASMTTQEQRPPLPARQQQYVDVSLTGDMSSLVEQIELARTGGLTDPDAESRAGASDEPVDLSAVLFVDDEDGTDTPSSPVVAAVPAMASPEELAALFASPMRDEQDAVAYAPEMEENPWAYSETGAYDDDESANALLFAEEVAPEQPPSTGDLEFDALLASFVEADAAPVDVDEIAAQLDEPVAPAEVDFAGMFGAAQMEEPQPAAWSEVPAFDVSLDEEAEVDLSASLDVSPESAPDVELDLFGGEWNSGDLLDVEQDGGFEETGTVSDLMTGVGEVTGGQTGHTGMLNRLTGPLPPMAPERPADTVGAPPPIDDTVTALLAEIEMQLIGAPPAGPVIERGPFDEETGDTPARRILESTSEADQADSSFSLDHLITNIESQLPPNRAKVQPLPSWLKPPEPPPSLPEIPDADETVTHNVAFEAAPFVMDTGEQPDIEPAFDWDSATFDETTLMGAAALAAQPALTGDEETSWLEMIAPEEDASAETVVAGSAVSEASYEPDAMDADWEAVDAEAEASARAMQAEHIDDPYIAQLALSLTDVSLELTAEAMLLTRGQDIAAFAGRMSRDELLELRQVIDDDWEATANDARIRFLRLPTSGKDIMLYSRRTVEDLTLSLVFDGAAPLKDIRLQGKRLMDALAAVPEAPVEIVLPPPADEAEQDESLPDLPRSPHAFVWLLRDADASLARPVAQAIVTGLNQQMIEHGWKVREMRASEDHIYLFAESPDTQPPYVAVRELMRRSAQIAHVQNPSLDARALWSDAYLVVTPGRSLDAEEIQQFIQFERML